jgi:Right handed beta helix region
MRPFSFLSVMLVLLSITGCGLGVDCVNAPAITGQPSNQIVDNGEPAIFTVAAIGTSPLSYQWMKNGLPIPGATQATYVTPVSTYGDSLSSFSVSVSNYLGQLTSSPASLAVIASPSNEVRFVAPTGDDTNTGTIDQPYRTIQHCASTISPGGTCEVRGGTYRETITPNSNITITAYHLEPVVVDGSDPVSGWTIDHGTVYKARVTLNADDTNQLFVGSEMMTEARWPNGDDLFNVSWAKAKGGTDSSHIVDSKLPPVDWTGAKVHLWSGSDPFSHQTGKVVTSSKGRIGIDVGQTGTCPAICPSADGYYFLFGTINALDVEREWFYDANSTTLYFMAPGGANPNNIDVRSKQRLYAFDLRGKTGVTIANISIFASTIITDELSSYNTLDRIAAKYVSHFTALPPAADDPNGVNYSILLVHTNDSGITINGTGNTVENSTVDYSAGAGIALAGVGNIVRNNLVQHIDYIGNYSSGITLNGNNNTIQSNTINDVGRQGISINAVQNQDISQNNLFNGMLLSRDGAEIYACCNQSASGTRIHHNWVHDTVPIVTGQGDSSALSGVMIDNGSGGFNVDQNVVWNNKNYNILINGISGNGPNNNHVLNNTIPDSSSGGQIRVMNVMSCNSTRVADNQVVVTVKTPDNGSACSIVNNNKGAPGATEMSTSTQVGCNFAGCASNRPPAILAGGSVTPCPVTGAAPF